MCPLLYFADSTRYELHYRPMYFFFFKQKTAYEVRISDWSSDVRSSDLLSRGCRCIEIDVWNGDAVPSRDRSKSPHVDHSRGLSGSSLPNAEIGRASCRERVCQ